MSRDASREIEIAVWFYDTRRSRAHFARTRNKRFSGRNERFMGRELRQDVVSLFPYMVIPPLEFHSNDEWTHPAYTQPDNISPGALACHE